MRRDNKMVSTVSGRCLDINYSCIVDGVRVLDN